MLLFSLSVFLIVLVVFLALYTQPYHFNLLWWWYSMKIFYSRIMILQCDIRIWDQVIRCMGGTHGDVG